MCSGARLGGLLRFCRPSGPGAEPVATPDSTAGRAELVPELWIRISADFADVAGFRTHPISQHCDRNLKGYEHRNMKKTLGPIQPCRIAAGCVRQGARRAWIAPGLAAIRLRSLAI